MRQIMTLIDQERHQYERHPAVQFLRDANISPAFRLAYAPYCCHWIMTFADINNYVLRDEHSTDPYQQMVNRHADEDGQHWHWYLEDLERLHWNPHCTFTDAVRFLWHEQGRYAREMGYCIIGYAMHADPLLRLVLIETLEAMGQVWFSSTLQASQAWQNGPELVYFGPHHEAREMGHTMGTDSEDIQGIELPAALRPLAEEIVHVLFAKMAAFKTEVIEHVRRFIAADTYPDFVTQRLPHTVPPAVRYAEAQLVAR
jgi:hypothetical protein